MGTMEFLKAKWRNVMILALLVALVGEMAVPAMAQLVIVQPPASVDATDVGVAELGEATYDDLQNFINNTISAGRTSGGVLTASGGAGDVSVASGTGFIKITPGDPNSETKSFDWDPLIIEAGDIAGKIKDGVVNYIYIDYNAGFPVPKATDDRAAIDMNTMFTLGRAYRSGATTAHVISSGTNLYDHIRVNHERLIAVRGFERASGGVVSQVGERYLSTTTGTFYLGANKVETNAQDTSGNGHSLVHWYHDGGGNWVADATAQGDSVLGQVDNDNYDNGTGFTAIGTAKYGIYWVFIHMDSDFHVVYGRDSYKLANAERATVPAIPDALRYFSILAAKIIVKKDAPTFISIVSAYETLFPVSTPLDHGDLGGLTADDHPQYLLVADLENPPTEDEASKAPTSEWAFDLEADFALHADRHDIGAGDPITWRDAKKLFHLLSDRRVLHIDLKTYDMWETYTSGSGINYQALMIASAQTGATAGSCARQNTNSQATNLRLPAHHAYYIYLAGMTGNSLGFVGCVKGVKLTESQTTRVLTTAHGGIWYEDGTWYASVSDGTTQTIESISLEAGAGWLIIIYEADAVKFYWRGAPVKTLVVTLPTTGMYGYFQYYVYNKALNANKIIYFYGLNFIGD